MGIRTFVVNSFAREPFTGNPAGVCLLEEEEEIFDEAQETKRESSAAERQSPAAPRLPSDAVLQKIAAELRHSETAFVWPRRKEPHDGDPNPPPEDAVGVGSQCYNIRWMTPTTEVDLCGHGTLAAAHVLFDTSKTSVLHFFAVKRGSWLRVVDESRQTRSRASGAAAGALSTRSRTQSSTPRLMSMEFPAYLPLELVYCGSDTRPSGVDVERPATPFRRPAPTATYRVPGATAAGGENREKKSSSLTAQLQAVCSLAAVNSSSKSDSAATLVELGGLQVDDALMASWMNIVEKSELQLSSDEEVADDVDEARNLRLASQHLAHIRGVALFQRVVAFGGSDDEELGGVGGEHRGENEKVAFPVYHTRSHTALAPLYHVLAEESSTSMTFHSCVRSARGGEMFVTVENKKKHSKNCSKALRRGSQQEEPPELQTQITGHAVTVFQGSLNHI
eukprot:g11685.t1